MTIGPCRPALMAPSAPGAATEPGGFSSVQEHGERPARRRVTHVHRAPFQLRLRLDLLDTGAATTVLFLLQPEDADSTRIYTCVLLSAAPGEPLPGPDEVAAAAAAEERLLAEDLELQAQMASTGLPLGMRDELHVPADRLGVALRRALDDFTAAG